MPRPDPSSRREDLLRRLTEHGYVSSHAVAAELGLSEMTIRRDLHQLAQDGLAHKVAGGATRSPAETFDRRVGRERGTKAAMARAALPLLAGVRTLALDAGTTVAGLARHIPAGTHVVTHSLPVLTACQDRDDVVLQSLGGTYHLETRSFAGAVTRAALAEVRADAAVLSAVAVSADGAYCSNPLDAEIKRTMIERADRVLLLVDHTKLAARAPLRFLRWEDVDVVVTDAAIAPPDLAALSGWAGDTRRVVVAGAEATS